MTCKTCGSKITAGPKPYYEEVKENVLQTHETVINQTVHAVGVRVSDAWNVPQEGDTVSLKVEDVSVIPVGSYLYHPSYGYYLISQWNPTSQQISITNDGIPGNAGNGSFVPARTLFLVSPKPCCQSDQNTFFPYLSQDFRAPYVNQTITVDVTSTLGLRVGDHIRIGTGVYQLEATPSTKRMTIRNEGSGHTPASTVSALNSEGEYQYLISVEASFVCTVNVLSNDGRLIVCDEGDQRLLTGGGLGQVPILQDPTTGQVEFGLVGTQSLQNSSVNAAKIANNSVTTDRISNGAVTTAKILDANVTTPKIADGAINAFKILDANVIEAKIADGAVTNAKLAAGAILNATLPGIAAPTVFTPAFIGPGDPFITLINSLTGKYWRFGPFIIAYIEASVVVANADAFAIQIPTDAVEREEDWPGVVTFYSFANNSYDIQGLQARANLNGEGSGQILISHREALTGGATLIVQAFVIYPERA